MKNYILLVCCLLLLACEQDNQVKIKNNNTEQSLQIVSAQAVKQIEWDELIPEEYSPETIFSKYQKELDSLEDDEPQAEIVYQKILDEMAVAPINKKLADKQIKLAGFIAPLTQNNGKISAFLLVPYFGACIHVPPPPANQTVLVKTAPGYEIDINDAQLPIQVSGKITLHKTSTDIGEAGYRIDNATIEAYTDEYLEESLPEE